MSVIDLIIRIKNGYMVKRERVESPYSKYREAVARKLKELGFIENYVVVGETKKTIIVDLRYEKGTPAMTDVRIFSTPGRRMYQPYRDVKSVKGGMGHALISTSKGIVTDHEAKESRVGGELLFHIW